MDGEKALLGSYVEKYSNGKISQEDFVNGINSEEFDENLRIEWKIG